MRFHDGIVTGVLLRARAADGHQLLIAIRPEPSGEDCLIYTTIGTSGRVATWEAEGRIVVNP